ncbi:endonuclease/exonuclease/phosphatase family protein [Nonomuraea sp. NPDC050328]|uniref:endonuclease/exonuclease/phosphatase family protein n=1 Tax=Nonomuraea sp. NPDC050328 TaxID=3364361 RepID=UPI0037A84161
MLSRAVVIVSVLLAAVLAGHGLLPPLGGATTILESVLPWLGWLVPILLVVALISRSVPAIVAALVPGVVWAAMFGPTALASSPGGQADLRVGTVNVGVVNNSSGLAVKTVAANLDVLAAQELTPGGPAAKQLNAMFDREPATSSTVGLWSRFPIVSWKGIDPGLGWKRGLRAVLRTPKGEVTVYVVHLGSARPGHTEQRDRSLATLRKLIDADTSKRILVLGDLNTATTDRGLSGLTPPLLNAQTEAGDGFGFTWPSSFPVTRPDHILYRGMTAVSAGVAPAMGSDHRAAIAGLRI